MQLEHGTEKTHQVKLTSDDQAFKQKPASQSITKNPKSTAFLL